MRTIARNHTRKIAIARALVVKAVVKDLGANFEPAEVSIDAAFAAHQDPNAHGARLVDYEDGTYTIRIHSNLWFELYTREALDRLAAEKAKRAAELVARQAASAAELAAHVDTARASRLGKATSNAHDVQQGQRVYLDDHGTILAGTVQAPSRLAPSVITMRLDDGSIRRPGIVLSADQLRATIDETRTPAECREQRNAATLARTTSIHDLGKPASDTMAVASARTVAGVRNAVTVTRTRVAIGTQIAEACAALGIDLFHGTAPGGVAVYVVNGRDYTPRELADLVLDGGFDAAYGAAETRPVAVNPFANRTTVAEVAATALLTDDHTDLDAALVAVAEVAASDAEVDAAGLAARLAALRLADRATPTWLPASNGTGERAWFLRRRKAEEGNPLEFRRDSARGTLLWFTLREALVEAERLNADAVTVAADLASAVTRLVDTACEVLGVNAVSTGNGSFRVAVDSLLPFDVESGQRHYTLGEMVDRLVSGEFRTAHDASEAPAAPEALAEPDLVAVAAEALSGPERDGLSDRR